ncbi:uncharacterized protein LOC102700341 isoform X2 [Oryza brachyantha]|uniref:uncharacterized protein LOC102700341 isoform X2 n=1 Tax=Oryza brachyantha TaxID=4533 RepID=UPI001ADCF5E5|nr:uncharacterized protein LOC102700341 isoform X2 [Oryza brachyantha]
MRRRSMWLASQAANGGDGQRPEKQDAAAPAPAPPGDDPSGPGGGDGQRPEKQDAAAPALAPPGDDPSGSGGGDGQRPEKQDAAAPTPAPPSGSGGDGQRLENQEAAAPAPAPPGDDPSGSGGRRWLRMEYESSSEEFSRLGASATVRFREGSFALRPSAVAGAADPSSTATSPVPQVRKGAQKRKRKRGKGARKRKREHNVQSTSTTEKDGAASSDSSGYSSPIRRPKSLLVKSTRTDRGVLVCEYNNDEEAGKIYREGYLKYQKKLAAQQQLPTLKPSLDFENIGDWHNLNQKSTVLGIAKSVISLSSTHDEKEIKRCTGIIIEHDEKSAILVTSSRIICTKEASADWKDNNIYAPNVKVIAHLLDGTTSEMQLLYLVKHYEIAFFKVNGASDLQVALLDLELEFGGEGCVLARDKNLDLICRRTRLLALDPCGHQKNFYSFINASDCKGSNGGALAYFNGNVAGMVIDAFPNVAFIPSSLILKCFRLWKKFRKLGRPHLGLKLRTVTFLDISILEHLSRVYGISSGLIVAQIVTVLLT